MTVSLSSFCPSRRTTDNKCNSFTLLCLNWIIIRYSFTSLVIETSLDALLICTQTDEMKHVINTRICKFNTFCVTVSFSVPLSTRLFGFYLLERDVTFCFIETFMGARQDSRCDISSP